MPRLPDRYKTRWCYAVVAALAGFIFSLAAYFLFYYTSSTEAKALFNKQYLFGLIAFPVALICWPSASQRSAKRMAGAGVLTVLFSMALAGLFFVPSISYSETIFGRFIGQFAMAFVVPIVVSIVTLGIPYIVGAVISVLFAD